MRFVVKFLYCCFTPILRVENEEALPLKDEPLIFTFNHNNAWETLPLALFLLEKRNGRIVCFVIDWIYGKVPLVGWILDRISPIYVYNKPARWKSLNRFRQRRNGTVYRQCVERLATKGSIGIFPEGKRNGNAFVLKRGRKGIGAITLRTGAPVLPIGIDFPCRIHQGRIPKFGRLILRIGEPLTFPKEREIFQWIQAGEGMTPQERKRFTLFLDGWVTHQIMTELGKLSGKAYPFQPPGGFLRRNFQGFRKEESYG
jgi:1-acyl-sn-glycerol-3-phosphate acyltransferase